MKKKAASNSKPIRSKAMVASPVESAFDKIVELIRFARMRAVFRLDSISLHRRRRLLLGFAGQSFILIHNKTRQGYALRSILKPAGYFFVVSEALGGGDAVR